MVFTDVFVLSWYQSKQLYFLLTLKEHKRKVNTHVPFNEVRKRSQGYDKDRPKDLLNSERKY